MKVEGEVRRNYNNAIIDTNREKALEVVHTALSGGMKAEEIVFQVVIPSIETFLHRAAAGNASLAQHFLTAQIAWDVVDELLPLFDQAPESVGTIVIGTPPGDFHGLGKRIVTGCLKAKMITVHDLGLNVPAEKFVDAAMEHGADVIAISSMMIHTARGENGCLGVRRILKERGLEDRLKIIVGGAPFRFDDQLYRTVGADAWSEDGLSAADVVIDLIKEVSPS
jgi:methanogenic corrinoid protein MtbC1